MATAASRIQKLARRRSQERMNAKRRAPADAYATVYDGGGYF